MTQRYRLQIGALLPLIALAGCDGRARSTPGSKIPIVHVDRGESDGGGLLDAELSKRAGKGYKVTVMMSRDGIEDRQLK